MKKILSIIILILVSLSVLTYFYFNKFNPVGIDNKLQVTASFYPMYFFASQIGGDKINVINITPFGAEPHDYDLTPQDIIKIEKSKLLILNGNVETWADKIKDDLKNKNIKIITVGEKLGTINDPHIWLSPKLAKIEALNIEKEFEEIDPENKNYYLENLKNLNSKLDEIDKSYKEGLDKCEQKNFVTSHAAFGYLAKDYGLTQIAIDGLSPDEEPSLSKLAEIANFAKKNNVKYIFFESLVSPKLSETLANEIGAKTLVLDPIEGISSEAVNINYLTLMTNNLQNLKVAMSCK